MPEKRLYLGVSLAFVATLCGVFGGVMAQEGTPPQDGVSLDVTVKSEQSMTGPQMLDWVDQSTSQAKTAYFRVQNMLDRAREDKDTLKITCLDDKLTQIHVHMKGIEERNASLKAAVSGGDSGAARQQFSILKIYFSRIQGLVAEAENCIGDVDVVLGDTKTEVTVDDDITAEDPTEIPTLDGPMSIPPHASGYY